MARKKAEVEPLHQPIRLSGDVTVDVFAPAEKWPVIQWIGKYVIIAVDEASLPVVTRAGGFSIPAPIEAAPADTPELAAARAALMAQFPAELPPKKPLTAGELAGAHAIDFAALSQNVSSVGGFVDEDA